MSIIKSQLVHGDNRMFGREDAHDKSETVDNPGAASLMDPKNFTMRGSKLRSSPTKLAPPKKNALLKDMIGKNRKFIKKAY